MVSNVELEIANESHPIAKRVFDSNDSVDPHFDEFNYLFDQSFGGTLNALRLQSVKQNDGIDSRQYRTSVNDTVQRDVSQQRRRKTDLFPRIPCRFCLALNRIVYHWHKTCPNRRPNVRYYSTNSHSFEDRLFVSSNVIDR